jgi:hypothetical protein
MHTIELGWDRFKIYLISCSNVCHGFIYLWLGTVDELLYIFLIGRVITTFSKVPAPSKIVTEVRHFFPIHLEIKVSKHVTFTFVFHVSVTRLDGFVKFAKFKLN